MVEIHKLHATSLSATVSNRWRRGLKFGLKQGGALSALLAIGLAGTSMPSYAQSAEPLPDLESAPEAPAAEPSADSSQLPADTRFACQIHEGEYTVMYLPESQPNQAYPWATPTSMGGGWDAEKRCYTISERLESYRPEGLVELQVGLENGYDVVCATTEQVQGLCKIVFTVPLGQNPVATRDRVFENLALADAGNDTTVVTTFTGASTASIPSNIPSDILGQIGQALNLPMPAGSSSPSTDTGINLKPFLDAADGGTGTALTKITPTSRTLSPDNFR
jgi:hypothetical protein